MRSSRSSWGIATEWKMTGGVFRPGSWTMVKGCQGYPRSHAITRVDSQCSSQPLAFAETFLAKAASSAVQRRASSLLLLEWHKLVLENRAIPDVQPTGHSVAP